MSKKDDERLKNLLFFKVYMTDKEVEDAVPVLVIAAFIVVILGGLALWIFR